ncbi:MAG: hypothetical protein IJX28_02755 [Clostridia bacterium]|nr:hypothetical protein [Clostridia bacterium]
MTAVLFSYLLYVGKLLLLTLGSITVCGLLVRLCALAFARLVGGPSEKIFTLTALVGTPVHELGHAMMCPLFGHKIERIKLLDLRATDGVYGYVNHSYPPKSVWARLGNLFIGVGPIFSGIGVVCLTLWLCFPAQWAGYLAASRALWDGKAPLGEMLGSCLDLLLQIPAAVAESPWKSLLGIAVILSVALHISLSPKDIRSSLNSLPPFLLLVSVFALVTRILGLERRMLTVLSLFQLRLLSLFFLVLAFALLWVLFALFARGARALINCF